MSNVRSLKRTRRDDARARRGLCMIVHAYYPLAEPRVQREAHAARDAGYDVTVIALRGEGESSQEFCDGVEVVRLPVSHRRGRPLPFLVREYLAFALLAMAEVARRSRGSRIGIVHVHAPPDFLVAAAIPARARGARVILDIHDLSPHIYAARFGIGSRVVELLEIMQRWSTRFADDVITVHEPYRRELTAAGTPESKIHVVMNAPDPRILPATKRRAPRARDALRVAYHGTITYWYGVDLVVDAAEQLRDDGFDVRVEIIGDGDELSVLVDEVRRRRLEDAITFSGRYLPLDATMRRVAAADCGVVPNRPSALNRFALSTKLFEYVALRIPVVVARLETLAAHFSEDEVTFFEPGSADALAEAWRWVAESPDEAAARAHRAAERAARYAWDQQREKYLAVIAANTPRDGPLSNFARDFPTRHRK